MISAKDVVRHVVSARGNLHLAAERASGEAGITISEYELIDLLVDDDSAVQSATNRLRALMTVSLFDVIMNMELALRVNMHEMSPDAQARSYAGLLTAFASLSAPAAKVVFDLGLEAAKAAQDIPGLDPKEVERELKEILSRGKLT